MIPFRMPMHLVLIGLGILAARWLRAKYVVPEILRQEDFVEKAASLYREAPARRPSPLHSDGDRAARPFLFRDRDVKAATAAMMRIMEIEGDAAGSGDRARLRRPTSRPPRTEMMKGDGKYPIIFDDIWPL